MSKKFVLMDREGAVDDYQSVVLLMTVQDVETLGVIVTPADERTRRKPRANDMGISRTLLL